MVRARLASLALAGTLLLTSGCSTSLDFLHPGRSRTMCCPVGGCPVGGCPCPSGCDCGDAGFSGPCCPSPGCSNGHYDVPLISNAHPPLVEGPSLFPPGPGPLPFPGPSMPPGAMMPPGAYMQPGLTMPPVSTPRLQALPPVVTIPQAIATPSPP